MLLIFKKILISSVATAILMHSALIAIASDVPLLLWEKEYGDGKKWVNYHKMSIDTDGKLLIAITEVEMLQNKTSKAVRTLIWKMDKQGKIVEEISSDLGSVVRKHDGIPETWEPKIKAFFVMRNKEYFLILDYINHPWLIHVNKSGKVTFNKDIVGPNALFDISKVIQTADSNYLLMGHSDLDSFIMKISPKGEILWKKKYDKGNMDYFIDGYATDDGGYLLIANSGTYGMAFNGPSEVLIGRYASNGEIISEKRIKGRFGSVTRSTTGGTILIYDRRDTLEQDVWLQILRSDLSEGVAKKISENKNFMSRFKIVNDFGNYIIIGNNEDRLKVTKITPTAGLIWNVLGPALEPPLPLDRFDVFILANHVYVISNVLATGESKNDYHKLNISKYKH